MNRTFTLALLLAMSVTGAEKSSDLPTTARWPVLRYGQPLHMLAILGKNDSLAGYQRVTRRMRATLEARYVSGADDSIYHVNDKWIEPERNPTVAELSTNSLQVALDSLRLKDGKPPADVIFSTMLDATNLFDCVKAGAVLVTCGNTYPGSNSIFRTEWPARPTDRMTWTNGGAQRADGAALSGLPLERIAGHNWIPTPEATPGSVALATGESGAVFVRKVGAGTIVFVPTGLISRHWAAIALIGRKYDHDEIWLRLWDQLLYETVRGAAAIPAYTDLRPGEKNAAPGREYLLAGKIVNRAARGPLAVSVHVTTPQGKVVFQKEETLDVAAGTEKNYEVHVPVAADWGAGLYPVYLTVGDPSAKKQFHQSLEFIPVSGQVALALAADKKGYRLGEEARFTLTASSSAPWTGTLRFGVYDFRGRLLGVSTQPATLTTNTQSLAFSFRMTDHGVRDDTFWAEVVARKDGRDWGRAETKFYKYEPWGMRNEYQWSTWPGIACAPPSLVPRAMQLMEHAGMNALGYAGRSELYYAAERWGWRYYNEGVGMNTWNPRIEAASDATIEAMLRKEAEGKNESPDIASAAFVLASVGEEAGFGPDGWGRTYYWNTPVAPDDACHAFQWYLKTKYTDLARLNATWLTKYQSWDEVKLTKEFSGGTPKLEADGWAHPKDSPVGAGVNGVSLAPYTDSDQFYGWYYDRIIAAAKRILREKINPVPVTMASAPSNWVFDSRECDVRLAGPGSWNESQMHSTMDGVEPGFSLVWGHFDWSVKTDDLFWGFLLTRSGHNNYWVDIPLMFNNDLTHTRASFAIREWTHKFAGHERIILDSRLAPSDVAVLGANGIGTDNTRGNMVTSLQVALNQGGFGLAATNPTNLAPYKIVFAVGHQAMSKAEAERLQKFVEAGGTLVFTSRFANQDEFGAPQNVSPCQGLAEKWSLQVTNRTEFIPQYYPVTLQKFSFKDFTMATHSVFREQVKQDGWTQLAKFDDHTPAILTRSLGKGRLCFVNMIYQSHWYIQWVTPTGPERQGFYKLVEWLCEQAGAQRTLRLDGDLAQVLHMAVKQFTDPTGHIRYVVVRTSGEVPWTTGQITWLGPQTIGYDVLGGGVVGKNVPLNFQPGAGKLFAFVEKPLKSLRVEVSPAKITAGQPIKIATQILRADDHPAPGSFPLELRVNGIDGLSRSYSAASGEAVVLNTALSDPPGQWTITVTDGISGLTGTATVNVRAAKEGNDAPGFVAWGWPSEKDEPAVLDPAKFVTALRALTALYRADHSADGWMTKQRLGYSYNFFPNTRHSILQPLLDLDWTNYSTAVRQTVNDGAEFIFTGEDLGLHPGSGLTVYPHHDAKQFAALVTALDGAKWSLASADGDTIAATLGKGRVIFCRESIDAAGHDNAGIARWQRRWLAELRASTPISTPTLAKLKRWWTGHESIASAKRAVTWFGGNDRELTVPPGAVFNLVVPPTGELESVAWSVTGDVQFDIGCDGTSDADWTTAAARLAHQAAYRDDNAWRIIPVRVISTGKADVKVSGLRIQMR